jgi:peptidyl-prolyl cis-trans isomerase A (cyclophilin A)
MRAATFLLALALFACGSEVSSSSGPGGTGGTGGDGASSTGGAPSGGGPSGGAPNGGAPTGGGTCVDEPIAEENLGGGSDPEAGEFTLDEALDGLPEGAGPLRAVFETTAGTITCELFPEIAPIGVANFVGLARGRRPFEDDGVWIRGRRFYDGLTFHRVIDDFVAQGGDPLGNGFGGPGYEFVNEVAGESHTPGTLSYANAGPDTNGSQFFMVAEVPAAFLDGDYTIFGRCAEVDIIQAMTEVMTDANDEPLSPIVITSVQITRC